MSGGRGGDPGPDPETLAAEERAPAIDPDDARVSGFQPPSIAAGGVSAFVFRTIELLAATLLVVVTGRLMEPAGRGLYALASLTMSILLLPLGAVWVGNVVELVRRRVPLREVLGGSLVIAAVGGVATGLLALAVAPLLGDRWWVVALPAVVTPFVLLLKYEEGLYTGLGHVRAVNLVRVARAVLPLVFIAPPLLAGASPRTAIAIWTLSFVVLPVLILVPLRSLAGSPRLPGDRRFYRRVVTYGGKISGLNAVDTLNDRVGLLALAVFASEAAVGIFSIAIAAAQVLLVAPQALALAAFRRIGISSAEPSAALTARAVRHSILLTVTGSLVAIPVVLVGVPWAVGEEYDEVPLLFALLIPNAVFLAALTSLYTYFQVQAGKPGTLLVVGGSALAANVGLSIALAPLWGTRGVAVAASCAGAIGGTVACLAFRAESGTRLRALLPGRGELKDYAALARSWLRRR
jgi:O-antigen/teichoic acid export membrane protein